MTIASVMQFDRTMHAVVATEFRKLRRSKVTWLSFLIYSVMVGMMGFMLWMMKNPALAAEMGLLGQKASFTFGGQAVSWATFLGLLLEMSGIGGMIFLSFIVAFVFGREYVEGTAKNMLTLPVPRAAFVLAKFVVAAAWFALLSAWMIALSLAAGGLVGLGPLEPAFFWPVAGRIMAASLLAFAACPLVAWIATASKGYFAPLGYAIGTMVVASFFGHTGWAPWCPWSIIGIFTGAAGEAPPLGTGSYLVLAATFLLGLGLTLRHEVLADNVQ
jgi:ABC-type transport system involved in multi-copper enzyme maturation permease subunit